MPSKSPFAAGGGKTEGQLLAPPKKGFMPFFACFNQNCPFFNPNCSVNAHRRRKLATPLTRGTLNLCRMSFQHLLHVWSVPAVIIAFLAPPSRPVSGTQYYSLQNAKFLGQDAAGAVTYRLIDSVSYTTIVRTLAGPQQIKGLRDSSYPITVDEQTIQSDLLWVQDSSRSGKREYQLYIFLDRRTGQISSLRGEPGDNRNSYLEIQSCPGKGVVYTVCHHHPQVGRILLAQVHGHPASLVKGEQTLQRMSPKDSITASCLQAPIYAIDAMGGPTDGFIHRSNPDPGPAIPGQNLRIGKIGDAFDAGHFDIALDALTIWGITKAPDFQQIYAIDGNIRQDGALRSTASVHH